MRNNVEINKRERDIQHSHSVLECDFYGLLSENKKKIEEKRRKFYLLSGRAVQWPWGTLWAKKKKNKKRIISIVNYSYLDTLI